MFFFKTAKPEAEGRLKSLSDLAVAREGKENLVQRKSHPNFETFDCIISTRVCKHGLEVRGSPSPSSNFGDGVGTGTHPL